ncbi:MAG: S41 family peptidase [Candidatus Didemnitutus sp.]|nr:S41 family peptidase [Candidatus Didemnitutus sp.]
MAMPLIRGICVVVAIGLGVPGAATLRALEEPPGGRPWEEVRREAFALVWETVNEAYFDPQFGGVDWAAVRARYEPGLNSATDNGALRGLLQQMLAELGSSHFAILPREAAVFAPDERMRLGTSGAEVGWVDGAVVITRLVAGGPAGAAGLQAGDAWRAIDGREIAELKRWLDAGGIRPLRQGRALAQWVQAQLRGPVGSEIIAMVESPGEPARAVTLTIAAHEGAWSEPVGNFPSFPVDIETHHSDGLGYLRFNVFARQVMKPVREFLMGLQRDEGLVLDLRGNSGGIGIMAAGLSGWLCTQQVWLGTMQMRQGVMQFMAFPQEGAFTGPVAVLIDGGSASTSEIMAAGLQANNRVRVFGDASAGEALPSSFKQLPTGDLFQYAIADVITPQRRSLEGNGVRPDVRIVRTRADLAAGRDLVRTAAEEWLQSMRRSSSSHAHTGLSLGKE